MSLGIPAVILPDMLAYRYIIMYLIFKIVYIYYSNIVLILFLPSLYLHLRTLIKVFIIFFPLRFPPGKRLKAVEKHI